MELRHLRYFLALAEELHFGRAAQRLHIVQPALSKQVMALERELGVELLDRSHGVSLTTAGHVFYEEAKAIAERVDGAVASTRATARGEIGTLNIGFVAPARWSVLPAILRAHRSSHPNLRYRLNELDSAGQIEQLRMRSLDVGFVRPLVVDDVLLFEPVWRERFVVALPDNHRLAGAEAIDLAELRDERFVVLPRGNAPVVSDLSLSILWRTTGGGRRSGARLVHEPARGRRPSSAGNQCDADDVRASGAGDPGLSRRRPPPLGACSPHALRWRVTDAAQAGAAITCSPGTRRNSSALPVATLSPWVRAVAAIHRSCAPMRPPRADI